MKKISDGLWLLDDGRVLNTETQKVTKRAMNFMIGDVFKDGTTRTFKSVEDFEDRGVIFMYCVSEKTKGKTTYVTLSDYSGDYEFIKKGYRKYGYHWEKFDHPFRPANAYMIYGEKNVNHPNEIKIIKIKEL